MASPFQVRQRRYTARKAAPYGDCRKVLTRCRRVLTEPVMPSTRRHRVRTFLQSRAGIELFRGSLKPGQGLHHVPVTVEAALADVAFFYRRTNGATGFLLMGAVAETAVTGQRP